MNARPHRDTSRPRNGWRVWRRDSRLGLPRLSHPHPNTDGFQQVVRERRQAWRAVAHRRRDARGEEGALVDRFVLVRQMWRHANGETDERDAASARPAEFAAAEP